MKRLLAAVALCAAVSPVAAQTKTPDPLLTRPGWMVGIQASHYHYEEPNFVTITGNRGGLLGSYTWTNSSHVFSTIDVRESYGRLKYDSNGTGSQNDIPDTIIETRAVVGMDFLAGGNVAFSPYIGLGYRYLYDDLRGYSTTGAVGYRRYSNYLYAPVGVTTRIGMGSRWVFAPTLEYDVFIQGRQATKLTDTGIPGLTDVTNSQNKGYGYRAYLMFEKDNWAFGAWMHYWNIKDSDIKCVTAVVGGVCLAGLEPANWTREEGLEVRYRF